MCAPTPLPLLSGLALLLLAAPAIGQSSFYYSPKHLMGNEGGFFSTRLGSHPVMRFQMADGTNRGLSPVLLKDVAMRLDHRNHTSFTTAPGRSWTTVVIDFSHGNVDKVGRNLTKNVLATPTQIFHGPVRWPDYNGTPPTRPALWGGFHASYRFPFKTNWYYDGKADILSDWRFTGGTLLNKASWTSSKGYWFDSYENPDEPNRGSYRRVPASRLHNNSRGVTKRCNDSYFGANTLGSYTSISARVYGPSASNANWRDKLVMWSTSYFTAPGSSVIHAWAFGTNDTGFDLTTGCNRLHLVGLTLYFTLPTQPANQNPLGIAIMPAFATKWVSGLSTLKVIAQGGWTDSKDGQLRLTQAHEVILPGDKPEAAPRRTAVFQVGSTVTGPDPSYVANPALRYGY